MSIKLGSWNLQNFAITTKKDINVVVDTILKFDLIALQEIRDLKGVEYLIEKTHYDYWISEPICSTETSAHQTGKRKERYAFLWKGDKVSKTSCQLICGKKAFVRPPAIGFFKTADGFDFIFSTIHLVWGQKRDREAEIKCVEKMLIKLKKICNLPSSLHSSLQGKEEKAKEEKIENNIILCGDFNTDLRDRHDLGWFTCIKEGTVVKSNNCYDNFWISTETTEFISAGVEKVNWSDHYPIYATFKTDIDNDELETIDLNIEIN